MTAIFADDILKHISLNGINCVFIPILLKYVPKGPIINMPALVQMMPWRRIGDKPLSEPMVAQFTDAYMRPSTSLSFNAPLSYFEQHFDNP